MNPSTIKLANRVFKLGLGLTIFTFLFNLIGFCTPYWYISWPRIHSKFVKIGLWEACFAGYVHPQDYNSKAYFGCWWILSKEYYYIRDWLQPPWFIICQVFSVFIIILLFISVIFSVLSYFRGENRSPRLIAITAYILIGCGFFEAIVVVLFGAFSKHRYWMPRQHENYPSWSYGLVVVSGFFAFFGGIALKVYSIMKQVQLDDKLNPAAPPSARDLRM